MGITKRIAQKLANLYRDDSGVVMLETVLVFPTQLLITMLIVQLAHIYVTANVLQYAAMQGARTVLVNFKGDNEQESCRKGVRAAWTVISSINNPGGGGNTLRVPGNNYAFSANGDTTSAQENLLKTPSLAYTFGAAGMDSFYSSAAAGQQLTVAFATSGPLGAAETEVGCQLGYWMELTVPVGGPFVYYALKAGKRPVRVNSENGQGEILLRQNSRLPKTWPH